MKMKLTYGKTLAALTAAFALVAFASCTHEILPDFCTTGIPLKVEVAAAAGVDEDDITGGDISGVTLYVFNEGETLLEIIPTQVGKTEILNHRGTPTLRIVAVANVSACHVPELTCHTSTLTSGEVCIRRTGSQYDGLDTSETPDDLFWGTIDVVNDPKANNGVVELPIKRMIAGVYVRVKKLREHVGEPLAADGDFRIVLGAPHDKLDFRGQAGCSTRAAADPVNHLFTGSFRDVSGSEYYEVPNQNSATATSEFERVLGTAEGCPVTVSIYHNDTQVTTEPITADNEGNPLLVRNGKLNTITVFFGDNGSLDVSVIESAWGSAAPIEKEF